MVLSDVIALDPNLRQRKLLAQHAGYARFAWNWAVNECIRPLLAERRTIMSARETGETDNDGKPILRDATQAEIDRLGEIKGSLCSGEIAKRFNAAKKTPEFRKENSWCAALSQTAAKRSLQDQMEACKAYFKWADRKRKGIADGRKKVRPPTSWRSRRKHGQAFRADNGVGSQSGGIRIEGHHIRLPKAMGGLVRWQSNPRWPGREIRECTIKFDGKRWVAICVYQFDDPAEKRESDGAILGVDVGLRHLVVVHDGREAEYFENPRPLKAALKKLRKCDKAIARSRNVHGKTRRSNRRRRHLAERKRIHRHVAAIREDVAKKVACAIAKRGSVVVIESLHVKGMMQNRKLARSVADAGLARLLDLIKWACKREGVTVLEPPEGQWFPSSKLCASCGGKNAALEFEERWQCSQCGAAHHRDENAALNLRNLAIDSIGRGTTPSGHGGERRGPNGSGSAEKAPLKEDMSVSHFASSVH